MRVEHARTYEKIGPHLGYTRRSRAQWSEGANSGRLGASKQLGMSDSVAQLVEQRTFNP
jgi:hypothetical protein